MRERLTTLGELAGFGAITAGFWMIAPAFGLIVGGAAAVVTSYTAAGGDS